MLLHSLSDVNGDLVQVRKRVALLALPSAVLALIDCVQLRLRRRKVWMLPPEVERPGMALSVDFAPTVHHGVCVLMASVANFLKDVKRGYPLRELCPQEVLKRLGVVKTRVSEHALLPLKRQKL